MKNNIIPIAIAIVFVGLLFAASSCSKQPESSDTANQQSTSTQSVASSTAAQTPATTQTAKPAATTPQTTAPKPYVAPKKTAPAPTQGQNRYVSIVNGAFVPKVITIKANDTVIWTNQDDIANVIIADDNSFESPSIFKGATYSRKFTTKGWVNYHNKLHNTLTGQVVIN